MDFVSGIPWSKLNFTLKNNYKEFVKLVERKRDPIVQYFQEYVVEKVAKIFFSRVRVQVSGSVAENTYLGFCRKNNGMEIDAMFTPRDFFISRDMQVDMFQNVPDEVGFVRLKTHSFKINPLYVKNIKNPDGSLCSYVVPQKNIFRQFDLKSGHQPSNKSMGAQIVFDTFDGSSMTCWQQGPAFTTYIKCCLPQFRQPEKWLFDLFGSVGNGLIEKWNLKVETDGRELESSDQEMKMRFGNTSMNQKVPLMKDSNAKKMDEIIFMLDLCLAIDCEGWPHKALRFFHRQRIWPDDIILDKLLRSGFHLVYKPLNPLSEDSVEWRISFSKAEITLFQNMDAFKVYCYRMFKAIYYCELTLPKVLCSYHMKTIFLWSCERIPSEMWVQSNLAQIIMGLLDDLLHCLVTKSCPHYFISENNLFAHVHQDFLDHLAKVVSRIRRNPERYPLTKIYLKTDDKSANQGTSRFDEIDLD